MKKLFIISISAIFAVVSWAQTNNINTPYYRNALTSMMIYHPEDEFGYDVYKIFSHLPALEKFDNHDVDLRVINNDAVTGVQGKDKGFHRQQYGGSMVLTAAEKNKNAVVIEKLLNDAQMGKRMVAKWFNLQGNSVDSATFSTKVLESRSDYNVTISEAIMARYTTEGINVLQTVSNDLIEHSFILVSDMTYITAEQRAEVGKKVLAGLGEAFDAVFTGSNLGDHAARLGEEIADSFTGFKVMTHSYLFQLEWNDSISNIFYTKYYTQTPNPERIKAFLADKSLFKVKYLGAESSVYEKTQKKGKYTRTGLLELITRRSIDKNIAELQSQYEAFRIKTPIMGAEYNNKGKLLGYRALVGQKEGVSEGRKYEVLETVIDAKGRVRYNRVATIKPVTNQIWDNRFNALLENDVDGTEGTLFTVVSSVKQIQPGMLIREQK